MSAPSSEKVTGEDLLTLIYTSGTTGKPKGVTLTHDNLVQNVLPSAERATVGSDDFCLEFLPLCHVFERMLGYLYMYLGVTKAFGAPSSTGRSEQDKRPFRRCWRETCPVVSAIKSPTE